MKKLFLALAAALSLAAVSAAIADKDPHVLEGGKECYISSPCKKECYFGSRYALHHVVFHGDLADVKRLLAEGDSPNSSTGFTAFNNVRGECSNIPILEIALRGGHMDVLKVLLEAGAAPDIDGGYLLRVAVIEYPEFVGVLLAAGADPNLRSADLDQNIRYRSYDTALMLAAEKGRTESIKLLLAAGASPNIKDNDDWNALMKASGHGHTEIVKMLLAAGANPNDRNELGKTALTYAKLQGDSETISLLEDAIAKKDAEEKAAEAKRQAAIEAKKREREAAERRRKYILVASVIGGSVLLLAAVVAVVYFLRRRKQRKAEEK